MISVAIVCSAANPSSGQNNTGSPSGSESEFTRVFLELEQRRSSHASASSRSAKNAGFQAAAPSRNSARKPLEEFAVVRSSGPVLVDVASYPASMRQLGSVEGSFSSKNGELITLRADGIDDAECAALMSFLATRKLNDDGSEDLYHLSLKNDALICLIEHRPLPAGLGKLMIEVVQDEAEGPIWREYVLQYYPDFYRASWPVGEAHAPSAGQDRLAMQRSIAAAIFHEDTGLGGTALIVLENLAADYPEFQGDILKRACRQIVNSDATCLASQITALSMMSEDPEGADVDIASTIAKDGTKELTLRMAAAGRLAHWSEKHPKARTELETVSRMTEQSKAAQKLRNLSLKKNNQLKTAADKTSPSQKNDTQ